MTEAEERTYREGQRQAWVRVLRLACHELGYDGNGEAQARWIIEREEAVAQLRIACRNHGDTDWDDHDYLADVIEKHLARHLT